MSRIFISYDRTDRPLTRDLAGKLRRVYDHVWYDENLTGGEDWWQEIRQRIAEADIFMYMLSKDSAVSEYCHKEHAEANRLNKEVLPVRISPVQPEEMPDFLRQIQYVDMSTGQVTADNLTELNAAINRRTDQITRRWREAQEKLLSQRRRMTLLRLLVAALVLMALLAFGALLLSRRPPFDSGRIAYITRNGANQEFRVVEGGLGGMFRNVLGGNPVPIPGVIPTDGSGFDWSPDGTQIVFASRRSGSSDIYIMSADGSSPPVQLTTDPDRSTRQLPPNDKNPTWSPDGQWIAFASDRDRNWEIYKIKVDGTELTNLTNNPDSADDFPGWSPVASADKIAFASNRDGNWEIYQMNSDGSEPTNLTENSADDTYPAWKPDGTKIAFHSNRAAQSPQAINRAGSSATAGDCTCNSNWDIWVLGLSELTNITNTSTTAEQYPAWSPDGKFLIYVSNQGLDDDLYMVDVDLQLPTPILLTIDEQDADAFPAWRS